MSGRGMREGSREGSGRRTNVEEGCEMDGGRKGSRKREKS